MKKTATQWGDESLAEAFHELMNVVINMRNAGVSLNQGNRPAMSSTQPRKAKTSCALKFK